MDADILRLILFLAGIGLILGIYFWDRRKRSATGTNAVRRAQHEEEAGLERPWAAAEEIDEPGTTGRNSNRDFEEDYDDDFEGLGAFRPEPEPAVDESAVGEQTAFSFSAESPEDLASAQDLPRKILQLNLVARTGTFSGDAIMQATRDVDLIHGQMGIFHRYLGDQRSRIIFSMANLVEPGNFDIQQMSGFSTPGLTLFAQLPGPMDGVTLLDEMLSTAHRMAALLDAEIQDESHSDMSRQTVEHLREEIVEFERKVRLARKKR